MHFDFRVDAARPLGDNPRFWAAAGTDSLYPVLVTPGGQALMARMAQKGACRYLRNHFTLSSLCKDGFEDAGGDAYSEDETGAPIYRFEKMNRVFAQYLRYGVKPIVELDFLPDALCRRGGGVSGAEEGRHLNRSYPNDWEKWRRLLIAFVRNLADTFGLEEIRQWYFEVWNEPDSWPVADWPMFHRLYDVFVQAVTGVDEQLRVGGPGTYTLPFLKDFLEHVHNGVNYVTGQRGTRIDFISHHIYGMSGGWLDAWPLVLPTVQRFNQQLLWISRMIAVYPRLRDVPFHLNEWGVCSNYEKTRAQYPPLEIRDSEFSALFFVKLVDCIGALRRQFGFSVELMLYWGFAVENARGESFAGHRDLMTSPDLPKPILSAHELLCRMDETALPIAGARPGAALGAFAAGGKDRVQILAYHFDETDLDAEGPGASGTLTVCGLNPGRYRVCRTWLDRDHHNTYRLWQRGASQKALAAAAALLPDEETAVWIDGAHTLSLSLGAHSLCLIELKKEAEK